MDGSELWQVTKTGNTQCFGRPDFASLEIHAIRKGPAIPDKPAANVFEDMSWKIALVVSRSTTLLHWMGGKCAAARHVRESQTFAMAVDAALMMWQRKI